MSSISGSSGIKFCSLNENSNNTGNEPEQEATFAFNDLDKGLRSSEVGEQCEAIVKFPKLFEKFPFATLINQSFLKLADVFRVGSNFLRLWVVKVCQQCEKHFDKIVNIDEFVRRIYSVIHSNDPIARALTLRTLGSVACIIPERQQVHHSIRSSLDSHNEVEVEAAIYAASQFAAQSKSFAVSMCNKISDMIQGLTTPAHMKLQLIPVLQYMHHDTATAAMVRGLCTELLEKYPAQEFVLVTLKSLTKLASATLVDIPDQVYLLCEYLKKEPRWVVRVGVLSGLYHLAKMGSLYWPEKSLENMIQVASMTHSKKLLGYIFDIFIILTRSPAVCMSSYKSDCPLMKLCQDTCLSDNSLISGKAVQVITQVASFCFKENIKENIEESIDCVESYLLFLSCNDNVKQGVLKLALHNAVLLCQAEKQLTSRFVHLIATQLIQDSSTSNSLLCEALGAIGNLQPSALRTFLPDLFSFLRKSSSKTEDNDKQTEVLLCTLIFQCTAGQQESEEMKTTVDIVVESCNLWLCYKISRCAARYGLFGVCKRIVKRFYRRVCSENLHFWMESYRQICLGECHLQDNEKGMVINRVSNAITCYCKALTALKAASTPTMTFTFQCEYERIRSEMLQAFYSLLSTCNGYCLSPAPAIATAITQNTRDELQRYGVITNQLRKRAKELRSCSEMYWKLYQSSFDADPISLLNIQALQYMCIFMAHSIESVALPNAGMDDPSLYSELENGPLEIKLLVNGCKKAAGLRREMNLQPRTITHNHISCIKKQAEIIILTPMCYPRFFFQTLQSTSVTLSINPQVKPGAGEVSISSGTQMAVKVEGVLVHNMNAGLYRSVSEIVLTASSHAVVKSSSSHDGKMDSSHSDVVLKQTVIPHRDFFKGEFLLAFPSGGIYHITIEAALVDQNGFVWQSGIKNVLPVRVHEDVPQSRSRSNV